MNATLTTIVAAGIAVLGTLLSPILVQYATRQQRQEEREAERQLRDFIELRSTYAELNKEMRAFHRALTNYLRLIRESRCNKEARDVLDNVREKYLECYFSAQMIIPKKVFDAARDAHVGRDTPGGLTGLYGMALRLDGLSTPVLPPDTTTDGNEKETIESAFSRLEEARSLIWRLRDIMRTELGIGSAGE